MEHLRFVMDSSEEVLEIAGKQPGYFLVHMFMPQQALLWETADISIRGLKLHNVAVRNMQFDLKTDIDGLARVIALHTQYLTIYQFDRPVPDTLVIENLPERSKTHILKQNGLKHIFDIEFEFLSISSFDEGFLKSIGEDPAFSSRIIHKA